MKKILILLLGLLIFSYSFSWEKEYKKDEFGDTTNEYQFVQNFKDGKMIIHYNNLTISKDCVFIFNKKYFKDGEYKIKFKSKSAAEVDKITEVDAVVEDEKIFISEMSAFKVIEALRVTDTVKFSFQGKNFWVYQENFNTIFNDFIDD